MLNCYLIESKFQIAKIKHVSDDLYDILYSSVQLANQMDELHNFFNDIDFSMQKMRDMTKTNKDGLEVS